MKETKITKKSLGNKRGFSLKTLLVPLVSWWFTGVAFAQEAPKDLTLGEAMRQAEKASPSLKAFLSREKVASESARAADSGFYPDLGLDAVASTGFPGSSSGFGTSGLDSFPGLVASPYRQGPAAGAYAKWDLLDASVWHQSAAAHYEYDASQQRTKFAAERVDGEALGLYLEAVRLKGERDAWQALADELNGILSTVQRFVRNGQYSMVQGSLIQDQLQDAQMRAADFDREYQAGLQRLALLTGMNAQGLSCPAPSALTGAELESLTASGKSPLVLGAQLEVKSADETASKFNAENLPVLEVAGSAGYLSDARLVSSQDYSLFVGVSLPLFEGFRIDAEEKAARAETQARQAEVASDQLFLDDLNLRYAEQMEEAREDLKVLGEQADRAQKAVALSRQRYLAFLGPLSDLQQALKDFANAGVGLAEAKTRLLTAAGEKYLLNGGTSENVK